VWHSLYAWTWRALLSFALAQLALPMTRADDGLPRALPVSAASARLPAVPEAVYPGSAEPLGVDSLAADPGGPLLVDGNTGFPCQDNFYTWQVLPEGIIYQSYLAGVHEPRMGIVFAYDTQASRWLQENSIGARVGILRYGTDTQFNNHPEGIQLDVEAGATPRLDLDQDLDLEAVDFRGGVPLTYGNGPMQLKLAYYHLSSHMGDEYMVRTGATRINYVRDEIVLGISYYLTEALRTYAEAGWAFKTDGGARPWEFQFGAEYVPALPGDPCGAPFLALGGHIRQDVNYGGNLVAQGGWAWRARRGTRLLRAGVQYYNGKSPQYEFFNRFEQQVGLGLWYDF